MYGGHKLGYVRSYYANNQQLNVFALRTLNASDLVQREHHQMSDRIEAGYGKVELVGSNGAIWDHS